MPNRKAAAGLVLGVVLIIVLIPTMIGLLGLGKMVGSLFGGTADIIPTEGKELIALGNPGDIRFIGYGSDASVKVQLQGEVGSTFPNLGSDAWYGLAAGDLDGDGYDEVIGLTNSSDIIIIPIDEIAPLMTGDDNAGLNGKNVSDLENWEWDVLHFDSSMNYRKNALVAGDLDNDGKDEILVVGKNKLVIYDYTGSSYVKTVIDEFDIYCTSEFCSDNANNNAGFSHSVSFGGGVDSAAVGNADYDDKTEVVVAYRTSNDYEESERSLGIFEIWKDDNGNYKTFYDENDAYELSGIGRNYPALAMCDYNEDGKDEILALKTDFYGVWGEYEYRDYVDVDVTGCDCEGKISSWGVPYVACDCSDADVDVTVAECVDDGTGVHLASTRPGSIHEEVDYDVWYEDTADEHIEQLGYTTKCPDFADAYWGTYYLEDRGGEWGNVLSPTVRKYTVSSTYGKIVSQGSVELPQPKIKVDYYTTSAVCDGFDLDYDWELFGFGTLGISYNLMVAYSDFDTWFDDDYECALNWPVKWVDIACDDFTGNGKMDLALIEEPGTVYIIGNSEIDTFLSGGIAGLKDMSDEQMINRLPWSWANIGFTSDGEEFVTDPTWFNSWIGLVAANIIGEKTGEESETLISE